MIRILTKYARIVKRFVTRMIGGGKRFFPDGVRLDLELVEQRRFGKGVIVLRYAVRGRSK
jgi:hypothetical protein